MDGLKKIDFNLENQGVKEDSNISSLNSKPQMQRRKINFKNIPKSRKSASVLVIVVLLILFSIFGIYLPATKVYKSAKLTYVDAQAAGWAIKTQNVSLASDQLAKTKTDLQVAQKDLNSMGYLRFVPIASWYYNDAYHFMQAGEHGINAATILVDSIKPYADVLGLKGQGSFVGGTAQQRIETAVKTIGKITPRIDDISSELSIVRQEIDKVNPGHYPTLIFGKKVRDTIDNVKNLTDQSVNIITSAKPLIKILPEVLGEPNEKKYLIIFQNDKELRPTGGFITAYAVFRLDSGVIHVDSSSDIYALDATVPNKPTAPRPILTYLPKVSQLNLRDNNLSPDFKVSMDAFYKMYKTAGDATKVDGIIAVDTNALVSAMDVLGDITTDGITFTTKNDPRCDCPQVIYQLEVLADQPAQIIKENRKGIIGDLMYAIMTKAFQSSPKKYWGPLFQTMLTQMSQKHVLFYMNSMDAQKGFEGLNAAGRIMPYEGDYFHLNEANFGGAKSNLFITQDVSQDYSVGSDGSITKTVTVNYKNPFAPSDCNLERGNLCLNAILRDWFRIYVPKGSQLVSSQGSEVKVTSYEELGKTVFEGFLTVRPQGASKLVVSYKLPF
ncbi:MAG TPA: DUF4012 domain-containing protein, partial [Candidatus Sulfotelmatobacter sp.]|nr:DUF4012 domain-containing protein [Candidatus Sulfotelmatobacter sp.]